MGRNKMVAQHGKAWMVRAKRCWPTCKKCHDAYKRSIKLEVYRRETGRQQSLVSSTTMRSWLVYMVDRRNLSYAWISRESGVAQSSVRMVHQGRSSQVHPNTETRIKALYDRVCDNLALSNIRRQDVVDAGLTRLAIRGLCAQGWTQPSIAKMAGVAYGTVNLIALGTRTETSPATEKAVVELARRIGSDEGPSNLTKTRSLAKGWKPTMYYDVLV
jgi:hypothetical protein